MTKIPHKFELQLSSCTSTPYSPIAKAGMLIRQPVAPVFEAFIDPATTSNFWFTKGTDRLQVGKQIYWTWEMYGITMEVNVKEIQENAKIVFEWNAYNAPTLVEWQFTPYGEEKTFVYVINKGFKGNADEIFEQALSSTEGFSLVLAGAKAFLEKGIVLNLIADRFPNKRPLP